MSNTLIKRAHTDNNLTEEQMVEFVKCAEDPFYFIRNYVKVQHPSRGSVLFDMYPFQERFIHEIVTNTRICAMMPRQAGKTATIVAYLLWDAIFFPNRTIGIAAHKGSGAKEFLARVRFAYENLPYWLKPGVLSYNVFDISFDNGSRIISSTTTENTFRGMSMSVIALDEFAFVSPSVADEFFQSLLPALAAGESDPNSSIKLIITSTPNGSEGQFASIWFGAEQGINGFRPVRVYNEEVPGRDEGFKDRMIAGFGGGAQGQARWNQEFECQFISTKGTLIDSGRIESIRVSDPLFIWNDVNFYQEIDGRRLGIAVDVSEGIGQDYSVIQIMDIDSLEQVGQFRDNTISLSDLTRKIIRTLEYLHDKGASELFYTIEANSIGQSIITLLENQDADILEIAELVSTYRSKSLGITMSSRTKPRGCSRFKDLMESDRMTLFSRELVSELRFFVKSGNSFKAESGKTDDLVMSIVLFVLMLEEISAYDDNVSDTMNNLDFSLDSEGDIEPLPIMV